MKTIIKLSNDKNINFNLLIGSAHYSKSFGLTIEEIDKIKLNKSRDLILVIVQIQILKTF